MSRDIERAKAKREARRSKAIELLGGKCVNCGTTERLQFDHINNDREGNNGMISVLLHYSWQRLLVELKKCQLLCISCHAVKTGADRSAKESEHGIFSTYVNRKCRCEDCRAANANHTRQFRLERVN